VSVESDIQQHLLFKRQAETQKKKTSGKKRPSKYSPNRAPAAPAASNIVSGLKLLVHEAVSY
jgi:hypothetical protein